MAVADNIYISTGADMVSVANKIRDKAGVSDGLVFPDGWIEAIEGIEAGSGGITPSGNKAITATTSTQTGIDVRKYATVSVAPTPSETKSVTTNGDVTPSSGKLLSKVTVNVPTGTARDSSDLTVSGATVNVPAGLYSSAASKSVASGTAGTPTASKGTVSNNSITVTPSVTNTTGYITGGTKTGTGVTVSASELVSGNKAITPSETAQSGIDVTNFKTASVSAISSTYVGSGVTRKAAATITPTESEQVISAGQYLEGDQTIQGDSNLIPENIASGVSIFGIIGTHESNIGVDTSDATATANNIENGKTAYVKGEKITGNLPVADILTIDKSTAKVAWDNGNLKITGTSASKCILHSFATINIPVSGDKFGNVTADNVVSGATFTSTAGLKVTGTMVVQKYYTGNTAPSNSLGNDGDLYLQA